MSVHGNSERYILIGKSSTKYYLEHSIIYSSDRTLDFPAQIYNVQPEKMEVNEEEMSIRHTIKASYVEGNVALSLVLVTEFLQIEVAFKLLSVACKLLCIVFRLH